MVLTDDSENAYNIKVIDPLLCKSTRHMLMWSVHLEHSTASYSPVDITEIISTSLPKVIWEESRVAALSHTYAVKSRLNTMARPTFAPKITPSRGPIAKHHRLPYPWTRPTYNAKRHPDPIRRFSTMHWTDRPTDRSFTEKFDDYRLLRYTRATRPIKLKTFLFCLAYGTWLPARSCDCLKPDRSYSSVSKCYMYLII